MPTIPFKKIRNVVFSDFEVESPWATSTPFDNGMLSVEIGMWCCRMHGRYSNSSQTVHLTICATAVNMGIISLSELLVIVSKQGFIK